MYLNFTWQLLLFVTPRRKKKLETTATRVALNLKPTVPCSSITETLILSPWRAYKACSPLLTNIFHFIQFTTLPSNLDKVHNKTSPPPVTVVAVVQDEFKRDSRLLPHTQANPTIICVVAIMNLSSGATGFRRFWFIRSILVAAEVTWLVCWENGKTSTSLWST